VYKLNINETIECPKCSSKTFEVKREATYLYTYKLDTPASDQHSKSDPALPFLFDNREKIDGKEYLQCKNCGAKYPCDLDELSGKIHFTILQKAIRADHVDSPSFFA
jgi:DNA-directed RNA polymerase subunit RPC12/RpoP